VCCSVLQCDLNLHACCVSTCSGERGGGCSKLLFHSESLQHVQGGGEPFGSVSLQAAACCHPHVFHFCETIPNSDFFLCVIFPHNLFSPKNASPRILGVSRPKASRFWRREHAHSLHMTPKYKRNNDSANMRLEHSCRKQTPSASILFFPCKFGMGS